MLLRMFFGSLWQPALITRFQCVSQHISLAAVDVLWLIVKQHPLRALGCSSTIIARLVRRSCLDLANKHRLENLAFPAISTGVYGYPVEEAAEVDAKQ